MNKILIDALERRIPQVTDKEAAMAKLIEHVATGQLTLTEAQRFTDMLYPVQYEDLVDEDGEIIDRVAVTERVILEEPTPIATDNERIENLEVENMMLMIASAEVYEQMFTENMNLMLAIAELYEMTMEV